VSKRRDVLHGLEDHLRIIKRRDVAEPHENGIAVRWEIRRDLPAWQSE
jgi:hypothetical protein